MAGPRKIFRIEETAATRREPQIDDNETALRHAEIMRELAALRLLFHMPTCSSRKHSRATWLAMAILPLPIADVIVWPSERPGERRLR